MFDATLVWLRMKLLVFLFFPGTISFSYKFSVSLVTITKNCTKNLDLDRFFLKPVGDVHRKALRMDGPQEHAHKSRCWSELRWCMYKYGGFVEFSPHGWLTGWLQPFFACRNRGKNASGEGRRLEPAWPPGTQAPTKRCLCSVLILVDFFRCDCECWKVLSKF